ncbi:MAG: hypothetical protein IPL39_15030 [Opitutaceae bacterium]|nr:hypothetical protein [Opitutaceae bacterium]
MKTKNRLPTPAELATFMHAIGCGETLKKTWKDVTMATGFKPDNRIFKFGLDQWLEWERQIAAAKMELGCRDAAREELWSRVPLSEVQRVVAKDRRTLRDLYYAIGAKTDAPRRYADQERDGFWQINVERMIAERDRRASEKASKGGRRKAEKQVKKFEQRS